MNETLKRHLISAGITFGTVFFTTLGLMLSQGAITPDNLGLDLVVSIVLTAVRAAIKPAVEVGMGFKV